MPTIHAGENAVANAKTPVIENITLSTANTESSYTLPTNCRKFSIKPRQDGRTLKLSYTENESSTKYISVGCGGYWEDLIGHHCLPIYFQSPTAGTIVEIVAWS